MSGELDSQGPRSGSEGGLGASGPQKPRTQIRRLRAQKARNGEEVSPGKVPEKAEESPSCRARGVKRMKQFGVSGRGAPSGPSHCDFGLLLMLDSRRGVKKMPWNGPRMMYLSHEL
ncbi:MAG: hypothetical protein M1837_003469 [Sclerophora amabilis]|nr:MAG: hypothetical protein M1837_003469 [Sclerophora amabilis]